MSYHDIQYPVSKIISSLISHHQYIIEILHKPTYMILKIIQLYGQLSNTLKDNHPQYIIVFTQEVNIL